MLWPPDLSSVFAFMHKALMTSIKHSKNGHRQARLSHASEHGSTLTTAFNMRRRFLELLATGAGSIALAGCGGGGGGGSSPAAKSLVGAAGSPAAHVASNSTFWGINGHWSDFGSYSAPLATQLASINDLGFKHYRQGIFEISHAQNIANNIPQ